MAEKRSFGEKSVSIEKKNEIIVTLGAVVGLVDSKVSLIGNISDKGVNSRQTASRF